MKTEKILHTFETMFPNAKGELDHNNDFELLVAVVLSAQTTDIAVNKVTPKLFEKYKGPYELAIANQEDVEEILKTIGLYRNKAKNIIKLSNIII
ncbi:MAG TPA: endonuclease III, partial [Acholeplasmataceae bacterium]|nr:endonuclease III [Acholeplasmataceae bacterium]